MEEAKPTSFFNSGNWKAVAVIALVGLLGMWFLGRMVGNYLREESRRTRAQELYNQGLEHVKNGDIEAAIDNFTEAIELNPDHFFAHLNRGDCFGKKHQYERAVKDYSRAIELDDRSAEAYFNRGLCYADQGKRGRAVTDYTKTIELDPQNKLAYMNRGLCYSEQGRHEQAIRDFSRAIELDPDLAWAYMWRGICRKALGRDYHAIIDLNKAVELNPNSVLLYLIRGALFMHTTSYENAAVDFRKAVELDPDDAYARIWLCLALCRSGKDGRAELARFYEKSRRDEWPRAVIEMFLEKTTPDAALAAAKRKNTEKDKALKTEAFFYAGQFYLLKGERGKATDCFGRCVEMGRPGTFEYDAAKAELARLEKK